MDNKLSYQPIVSILKDKLRESFKSDIVDFATKRDELTKNGVIYNNLVEKLTMSIEQSHCESFLVFQDDIPSFAEAFSNASQYSIWRSMRNKFIFGYNQEFETSDYFKHYLFEDQPNILLIECENSSSRVFNLKTNKFVGKRADQQSQMYLLNRFDASEKTFESDLKLFPDKTRNLMGREVVLAAFDYRPYVVLNYESSKSIRDLAHDSDAEQGMLSLDGTETIVLLIFCEKYNCTIEIDTSEADDWGVVYPNTSGIGALGMVAKRKAEISFGAMYTWHVDYVYLDMSMYLVRSGITVLVPAPRRLASWLLPLEPFQPSLWAGVMICLVIEVLGLLFTHRFEHTLAVDNTRTWMTSFKYGYGTALKIFISQSGYENVKSVSLRVFLIACFLNDIIITSIYGGGLSSILTIPSLEEVADSRDRLVSKQLVWAADSEAWVMAIRGSDDPRMNIILQNFKIKTIDELRYYALRNEYMGFAVERLQFGHFAIEDYLTEDVVDRLKIMVDDIYFQYTVAFVSRLWPHLERYNNLIYMWHSSGFDKYWEWKIVADNLNSKIQKQVEATMFISFDDIGPVRLGMSNFAGILVVWILGIALSTLAFLWEVVTHRFQQKNTTMQLKFEWESE